MLKPIVVSSSVLLAACSDVESGTGGAATNATTTTQAGPGTSSSAQGGSTKTGTGASSSATGMLPVTPCPSGPGRVGIWEEVSPPEVKNPSNMESATIAVNPVDFSVYATAGNKTNGGDGGTGVLKSTDCGATWVKVSTGENSAKLETGVIWSLRIDFAEPTRMYLANGYGNDPTLYRSQNGGVDWQPLNVDPEAVVNDFVQAIGMNPANSKHVAITFHDNCSAPHTPLCLSQTKDGGDTWTLFDGPSGLGGWAEGASLSVLGDDAYLLAADSGAWYTSDAGASWAKVIDGVHYGSYGGGVHFGSDGNAYLGMANQGTFVSRPTAGSPLGAAWTLLAGSPQSAVQIDDGTHLYATYLHDLGGQPFWSAPLANVETWTQMPSPPIGRGAVMMAFDAGHHLVYAANLGAGIWRLRTE